MSTPLPGQIRCPTCHRSTPPAAYCTQCGSAIPESARARPRGLDREELQDRIRTHRPGDAAFRRGSALGEGPETEPSTYRPFQPEPEDDLVLPPGAADEAGAVHVDNTPPDFDDAPPSAPPTPPIVVPSPVRVPAAADAPLPDKLLPREPKPAPWKPAPAPPAPPPAVVPAPPIEEPAEPKPPAAQWSAPQDDGYEDRHRPPDDEWDRRRSGLSPLAIGGFVLLGVLAIAMGALVAGVFSGGVAVTSPSPTGFVSDQPSISLEPSVQQSTQASAGASVSPTATSLAPPDGFTARTEPCLDQPASQDGCGSSGATVSGGSVWVWVGWRKGTDADTLGVAIVNSVGDTVGTGSLTLANLHCGTACNGWGRFRFSSLAAGDYTIRIDRNGVPVARGPFTVNS